MTTLKSKSGSNAGASGTAAEARISFNDDKDKKREAGLKKLSNAIDVPLLGLAMVYLTIFLDVLSATVSTPVMPFYVQSFKCSPAVVGYLMAVWSLFSAIFPPYFGKLADQYGRRFVLMMSLLGTAMANYLQAMGGFGFFGHNSQFACLLRSRLDTDGRHGSDLSE